MTTTAANVTGTLFDNFGSEKFIAIVSSIVCVIIVVSIWIVCRCCCCKAKSSPGKMYESREEPSDTHEYIDLHGTVGDAYVEVPAQPEENIARSLSSLGLDLDPGTYLTARPSGYLSSLPPPPESWLSDNKAEVTSVETTSNGVSVSIRRGPSRKVIDIRFK